MFNRISKRSIDIGSIRPEDKSAIVCEQVMVGYDADTKEYGIVVNRPIRGDVISLVIFDYENDYVVDGKLNVNDKVVTFLKDTDTTLAGLTAEIKYLSE